MAVTGYWYPKSISVAFGFGAQTLDWTADSASIKCALMNSNFTGGNQSQTAADYWNDVSGNECATVTNYTAGGKTVGTTTLTTTAGSGKTITFGGGATTVWTAATLTARGAVVYKALAQASDSPVVFFLDFGADVPCSAGDFTITWHTDGMATITVA
jgi:hypothetical protein